jgi:N-acetylglucosaminyldiphosphoundecaprenol N-acetyl-beta-D-mannosaminyltransferase
MANILGINLSELSPAATLARAAEFLTGESQHYLVTPNPEIILASHHDEELFYILNKADLAPADGFGLQLAGWLLGYQIPRVTGADLTIQLLELAARQKIKVLILNWRDGLSSAADLGQALTVKFNGLDFLVIDIERDKFLSPEVIKQIQTYAPALLFTTLGFPYQEKILFHNLENLPTVRLGLGVGGAFDFLTGRAIRAPRLLRQLGLEWLWRLIKQPARWRRIYQATVVFTGKMLKVRFLNPYLYRPNVACLAYKQENGSQKILIVEREDTPGYWQLPQGGTDGEDIATAGARELREETGMLTNHLITKGVFKNLYRYNFPVGHQSYGINSANANSTPVIDGGTRRHQADYKGQKQSLYIAEFIGSDQEIKINFWDHSAWKWVDADNLVNEVNSVRQPSAKIFLDKFHSLNL